MKHFKKLFAFLLVLAMLISSVSVYAAESEIRFLGLAEGFAFAPGSVYTDSDLFQSFKNVMPGDSLSENIRLTNEAKDCDYVKFYAPTYREDNGVITITNHYRLIQTGQENLPIILSAAAGMLLILLGIFMMKRKNEKDQVK